MKELSIEEKAKAYDEAIERANELYDEHERDIALLIFPELKESEDEKIRKVLLNDFKNNCSEYYCEGVNRDMIIAWLEKQGKQRSADKVEPKFKVGDWITDGNITIQIEAIKNDCYLYCGDCALYSTKTADKVYHLWTIQDAKDGDVLVDKSNNRECPFLFKETKPSNIKTDCLNPLTILGYCGIGGAGFTKSEGWGDTANCTYYPATKEQCDLLFQKMKEAGYEWNAEKKELRKIEQESFWSEEDEKRLTKVLVTLNDVYASKELLNWVVSLKGRVQPKQEWSEEEKESIELLVNYISSLADVMPYNITIPPYNNRKRMLNFLKSLKPQSHWKPSDEQMDMLKIAVSTSNSIVLDSLYNDLKKLREE